MLFPAAEPPRTEAEDKVSGAPSRLPPGAWSSTFLHDGHPGKAEARGLPPPLPPTQRGWSAGLEQWRTAVRGPQEARVHMSFSHGHVAAHDQTAV